MLRRKAHEKVSNQKWSTSQWIQYNAWTPVENHKKYEIEKKLGCLATTQLELTDI